MRYSAFGFQSSVKVMVVPSREPFTTCSPTFFASAPLFCRYTLTVAGMPAGSTSVTVMTPLPPSHAAAAENSLMSQARALPAAPIARATEAEATPTARTPRRAAVLLNMDRTATFVLTGAQMRGVERSADARCRGLGTPTSLTGL